jgi:hypothetical protein
MWFRNQIISDSRAQLHLAPSGKGNRILLLHKLMLLRIFPADRATSLFYFTYIYILCWAKMLSLAHKQSRYRFSMFRIGCLGIQILHTTCSSPCSFPQREKNKKKHVRRKKKEDNDYITKIYKIMHCRQISQY